MAHTPTHASDPRLSAAGFFVLRTPLLPFDAFVDWSDGLQARAQWEAGADEATLDRAWQDDTARLRQRLRALIAQPEITHALFVASASLRIGIDRWIDDPDERRGQRAERALVRYFARMCGRATPFGLFSGCSTGRVDTADVEAAPPSLSLPPRAAYRLVSRLDFDYLFALTAGVQRNPDVVAQLSYRPNSSLHRMGEAWHYVESRLSPAGRTHHVVTVENDATLAAAIGRASTPAGATMAQIGAAVRASSDADVSEVEASNYVRLLVDNDILVSSLTPCVSGDPLDDLIAQFDALPALHAAAQTLRRAKAELAALDRQGLSASPAHYTQIAAALEGLPARIDLSRLCQVDMTKPAPDAVLSGEVLAELQHGIDVLWRFGANIESEPLRVFRDAFVARYDREQVPLLEALDEDRGVGFGQPSAESAPLLRGLPAIAPSKGRAPSGAGLEGHHLLLLRKLLAPGRGIHDELCLAPEDLPPASRPQAGPESLTVGAVLAAASPEAMKAGAFSLYVRGMNGPSGARTFGRFCHTDPLLEGHVLRYVQAEAAHDPDAIYAELVYLPEGRVGNVLCRPVMREYELTYLGRSGAAADRQLPVSDLMVSVESGHIVLRSATLGRRVLPRLTNAHGFLNPRLSPVYRFLCFLQHQHGVAGQAFNWGPLDALDDLPRVRLGRLVLATARWRLSRREIHRLTSCARAARFRAMQEIRAERGLPRWVTFEEGDNSLPVDLDNASSIDAMTQVLPRGGDAIVRELYPSPDDLCAIGPEGRFVHELFVPFVRLPTSPPAVRAPDVPRAAVSRGRRDERLRAPGSDWLYVKSYAGAGVLDQVLVSAAPLLERVVASNPPVRWFFVRYADPEPHLRIRFNGDAERLAHDILPRVTAVFQPLLASGQIWKLQVDSYEREIERYGGPAGLRAAEQIFFADSEAVLAVLRRLEGDASQHDRWRVALIGLDALLGDFLPDAEAKHDVAGKLREASLRHFGAARALQTFLGGRFRAERPALKGLLDPTPASGLVQAARAAFARRSREWQTPIAALRALEMTGALRVDMLEMISIFTHMHVNRLMRSSGHEHELMLYEFLFRLYAAGAARQRPRVQPTDARDEALNGREQLA